MSETMSTKEALDLRDAAYQTGYRDGVAEVRQVIANALSLTDQLPDA